VRRQAVVVERRFHHRACGTRGFGQPGEVTAQTSVSLDTSSDHMQLSPIRAWGSADPCAIDRDLDVIRGVNARATGALPFILITIERAVFDPPTGFDGAAPHAAIRDLRATKREQSAHIGRRPTIRHSAPPFREQVRILRRGTRWQRTTQRPLDARPAAAADAAVVPAAGNNNFPEGGSHATAAPILDALWLMAVWALPPRRRFRLHLVRDDGALDRAEHRFAVAKSQANALRKERRGLARDCRNVLSMEDLAS